MKERPILFNAQMVRDILEGRKTQTRRVIKPQPLWVADPSVPFKTSDANPEGVIKCPYGQRGDRLWVREAWRIGAWDENLPALAFDYCDGPRKEWVDVPDPDCDGEVFNRLWQQSTDDAVAAGAKSDGDGNFKWEPGQSPCRWRPSIHMPRFASRIMLELTDVRVERLQDISEDDAIAEGCFSLGDCECTARRQYSELWELINGKGSWDENPWLWVIEFKKVP